MRKVTKVQILAGFKESYDNIREAVANDRIAVAEDWSNYMDMLCKDGEITDWQYNNWTNPF